MPSDYIVIGADIVPTESNIDLFKNGDLTELAGGELSGILKNAAYRIFNLEVPLTEKASPIVKHGPNLIAPISTVAGFQALGADLLTLANNHILDQSAQGLLSTTAALDKAGIRYLGVGANIEEAGKPFVFEFAGKRTGVYACAEHEFSIADEHSPGANPFDPLWSLDHVEALKKITDFVIVLYHGGKEHYRYPSPLLQKTCRRLVDKGANLIICQHSHCIGCEEKYNSGTIVYGQGNFIFDKSDDEHWRTSLLVKVDSDFSVSYLPLVKTGNGVRLAGGSQGEEILSAFRERSEEIKEGGFIERQYSAFADSFLAFYLRALSGKRSLLFRVLNRLTKGGCIRRSYGTKEQTGIANYVNCEAHRELLSYALLKAYKGKLQ